MRRAVLLGAILCAACSGLEDLRFEMCGNGFIEPSVGEDCDYSIAPGVPRSSCGLPNTVGACRYVCSGDAECPAGYACGEDAVCRLPNQTFRLAGQPYRSIGDRFTVADLDGDGFPDVVGTNRRGAVVLYGSASLELVGRHELITGPPTAPVVTAALDEGLRRDLVVPIGHGIHVARTDENRDLRAVAHAAFDLDEVTGGRPVQVLPLRIGGAFDAVLALIDETDRDTIEIQTNLFAVETAEIEDASFATLAGEIARGNIDGPRDDGTEDVAVATRTSSTVRVYGIFCGTDPSVENCPFPLRWRLRAEVGVPGGVAVDEGVALADADADGFDDLYMSAGGEMYMARNRGDGTFEEPRAEPRFAAACGECAGWPLVFTDIDGDGYADAVTESAVITMTPSGGEVRHLAALGELSSWSFTAVDDFDGDGRRDVAVGQLGTTGLEIVLASDNPLFNPFFTETADPLHALVSGDFDGDGIFDAAVVGQRGDEQSIGVSYGEPRARLSTPLEMARFDRIEQLWPAFLTGLDAGTRDYRHDLLARVVRRGDPPSREAAFLVGTPQQQMVAPATIGTNPMVLERPRALAAGSFVEGGRADIAVATRSELWVIPSDGDGELRVDLARQQASPAEAGVGDVLMAAADLDGDPNDEVVVLTGAYPGVPRNEIAAPRMYVADFAGDGTMTATPVDLPESVFAPSSLRIATIGTNPNPRIIIGYTGDRGDRDSAPASGVAIYDTNGAGRVAATPTVVPAPDGLLVLGVAAVNIDVTPQIELLVLTQAEVHYLTVNDDGIAWAGVLALLNDPRIATDVATLRAHDFDGDGLEDFAISDDRGFYLFEAVDVVGERRRP